MIDPAGIYRILLINLAFIGDVLLSGPVARALKTAYPQAALDMMTVPVAAPIAQRNPYVDNVIVYDKKGRKKLAALWALLREVRRRRYDLAVCANFAPRGAMLAWAAGIPRRVGYDAQHAGLFLTHTSSAARLAVRHESENYLDVLRPLGLTATDTSLVLCVSDADREGLRRKVALDAARHVAVVCPVGSYPQKSWSVAGYAALLKALAGQAQCFLIGAAAERPQLEEINRAAGGVARILGGDLTLGELAALLSCADVLVTVDTGPLHIAQAVGTPVVALFGPTDPRVWGPRGARDIVLRMPVDCSPCWGKVPCSDNRCLSTLPADKVVNATLSLLRKAGG